MIVAILAVIFGGATPGLTFKEIYEQGFLEFCSGLLAVNRFGLEQVIISEQRCLPPQAGFALDDSATNFPMAVNSYNVIGWAQRDLNTVLEQGCSGWYWSFGPAILVGLVIRVVGGAVVHVTNRGKQGKGPLLPVLKEDKQFQKSALIYGGVLLVLFAWTVSSYMRDRD